VWAQADRATLYLPDSLREMHIALLTSPRDFSPEPDNAALLARRKRAVSGVARRYYGADRRTRREARIALDGTTAVGMPSLTHAAKTAARAASVRSSIHIPS